MSVCEARKISEEEGPSSFQLSSFILLFFYFSPRLWPEERAVSVSL